MPTPQTLMALSGQNLSPARLSESTLVLIDCQNEYLTGALPLTDIDPALDQIALILDRARNLNTPIIHIAHRGPSGTIFDREAEGGQLCSKAAAEEGELIIEKTLPNSFADTELHHSLQSIGRNELIFVGFQTHMCVSATVRSALDHGYRSTLVASAAATRDLPAVGGGVVPARDLHQATVAALADRFAIVVETASNLPD